ncbi:MAG: hypothetical protein C5B48_09820 [Candidatus Rokuibacteriota bacterium]|nr:MAG: hypothetical protein C5B48_09820 [Candidatus Rokubacteria bacterium]
MMRVLSIALLAAFLASAQPAPADDPEVPEKYMKVEEVRALIERQKVPTFVDVRPPGQYDQLHIRGALNIPLEDLPKRLGEVSTTDLVVLY